MNMKRSISSGSKQTDESDAFVSNTRSECSLPGVADDCSWTFDHYEDVISLSSSLLSQSESYSYDVIQCEKEEDWNRSSCSPCFPLGSGLLIDIDPDPSMAWVVHIEDEDVDEAVPHTVGRLNCMEENRAGHESIEIQSHTIADVRHQDKRRINQSSDVSQEVFEEALLIHSQAKYEIALGLFRKAVFKKSEVDLSNEVIESSISSDRAIKREPELNSDKDTAIKRGLVFNSDKGTRCTDEHETKMTPATSSICVEKQIKVPPQEAFDMKDIKSRDSMKVNERPMHLYIEALETREDPMVLAQTLTKMGYHFISHALLGEAILCFERSLRFYNTHPEKRLLECADMLDKMSIIYNTMGRPQDAVEHETEALLIYKRKLGNDHIKVASCLFNMGCFLAVQEKYEESKEILEKALVLKKKLLGQGNEDVAKTLYNLSSVYHCMGLHSDSLRCLEGALQIRRSFMKTLRGHVSVDKVAITLQRIGDVHRFTGNTSEAIKYYEQGLLARKQEQNENTAKVAAALHCLGVLEHDRGNNVKAMEYLKESLDLRKDHVGSCRQEAAACLCSIAVVHFDEDEREKALSCLGEALNIREELLGSDHDLVGDTHNNIAYYFCTMGEYDEAKTHLLEALRIREGKRSYEKIADTLRNLGEVHKHMGNGNTAVTCYEQELNARKHIGAKVDYVNVGKTYMNMGDSFMLLDQFSNALECYEEAIRIKTLHVGRDDPEIASIHSRIVGLHLKRREQGKALVVLEEILRIKKLKYGEKHTEVANTICQIGFINCSTGEWTGALQRFYDALAIFDETGNGSSGGAHLADVINYIQTIDRMRQYPAGEAINNVHELCGKIRA